MKKLLFLLAVSGAAWGAPRAAQAQYYYLSNVAANQNPGGLNTDAEAPPGGGLSPGWTTIMDGANGTAPAWSAVQSLPMPFLFNGVAVTDYVVSNTGVLTFTTNAASGAAPGTANAPLPSVQIPDKSICLWGFTMRAANASNYGDFVVTKTFGTAPNRQHWIQFNSVSDATVLGNTYWSIVLEEGSNAIYLVDQRSSTATSLTAGLQIDATSAVQYSANLTSRTTATFSAAPDDNTYYAFYPGQQPAYDLTTTSLTLDMLQPLGAAPYVLAGRVRNVGATAVTSYTANYSVNRGPVVSGQVTDNVATGSVRSYTHPTPWQPTAPGVYTLRVWMSNPNGQPDTHAANDTVTKVISVSDVAVQRQVLAEGFTSSTCPPCRQGNIVVRNVVAANPGKMVQVKYQQNYPAPGNDPYYTAESGARHGYYGLSSIPTLMLDGGWANNSQVLTTAIVNQYYAKPAFMAMDAVYTITGTTVSATAQLLPLTSISGDLVVHMAITERYTRNNARTNGETEFFHVMKKMMPDENGETLQPLLNRQMQTVTQTYTFPAGNNVEHFDSLDVVVFVQNRATKQVLQSISSRFNGTLGPQPLIVPLAVADEQALAAGFQVFPNPALKGGTAVSLELPAPTTVAVDVFDALGRRVAGRAGEKLGEGAHSLKLETGSLPAGLYVVRVTRDGHARSLRLVVGE